MRRLLPGCLYSLLLLHVDGIVEHSVRDDSHRAGEGDDPGGSADRGELAVPAREERRKHARRGIGGGSTRGSERENEKKNTQVSVARKAGGCAEARARSASRGETCRERGEMPSCAVRSCARHGGQQLVGMKGGCPHNPLDHRRRVGAAASPQCRRARLCAGQKRGEGQRQECATVSLTV